MSIQIASPAFKNGRFIPKTYTCEGDNISPPFVISQVPQDAKSLALIAEDPDAPMGTWIHWVIFNIPPNSLQLDASIPNTKVLSNGTKQGLNDFRKIGYGGPCPPEGTHRYFFKIFALNKVLQLEAGAIKSDLIKAMHGHILSESETMGLFSKSKELY